MTHPATPEHIAVQDFRRELARCLLVVEHGGTIIVTRRGVPVATITTPDQARTVAAMQAREETTP